MRVGAHLVPVHLLRDNPRIKIADDGSKTTDTDDWDSGCWNFREKINASRIYSKAVCSLSIEYKFEWKWAKNPIYSFTYKRWPMDIYKEMMDIYRASCASWVLLGLRGSKTRREMKYPMTKNSDWVDLKRQRLPCVSDNEAIFLEKWWWLEELQSNIKKKTFLPIIPKFSLHAIK